MPASRIVCVASGERLSTMISSIDRSRFSVLVASSTKSTTAGRIAVWAICTAPITFDVTCTDHGAVNRNISERTYEVRARHRQGVRLEPHRQYAELHAAEHHHVVSMHATCGNPLPIRLSSHNNDQPFLPLGQ